MSLKFLLDTNILSEPARPIPNANVLHNLDTHKSETEVRNLVIISWQGLSGAKE